MPVPPPYPHERRKGTILKEALLGNRAVTLANLSFTLRGTDEVSSSWFTCRSVLINVPANQPLEMIPKSMILNLIVTVFDTTSWLHLSKKHHPRLHALLVVNFFLSNINISTWRAFCLIQLSTGQQSTGTQTPLLRSGQRFKTIYLIRPWFLLIWSLCFFYLQVLKKVFKGNQHKHNGKLACLPALPRRALEEHWYHKDGPIVTHTFRRAHVVESFTLSVLIRIWPSI